MSYSIAFSQALEIITYINAKSEEQQYQYLSIQKIADSLSIPVPSVKKISVILKKSGLLDSKTGTTGGLKLQKKIDDITLYDVFYAIEMDNPVFKFHTDFDVNSFQNKKKVQNWIDNTTKTLEVAEKAMFDVLKNTTLRGL
ncbi:MULTISPECIES: RrF2 family transcriptional regulator [Leuconostoc]|nr:MULTISPECIES: Rrf2 family transcriptional regulator [Leuconostoc]VTU70587.1 putative transcriptional regulator [Lactobacillus rhamnosus GG] [Leuconostoc pseudomesenteroides]MBZ1513210.1 Rrf2 family transcriptional regulator [Leuconostoc mesenteroides]MBZ1515526.1 Rrf2 family transcriptional regulator [Leuconostoc mesenteroides]MBZ1517470.1 Rrf2 family transcriptional regulator [Leuconostoc mesenteroides]MBZ1521845.1 Rrf2 family transcriptional regulator [Leuconostoc mesenteroides]